MLWSKQLYNYDVARWLDGDPTQPTPPPQRRSGRNSRWRNFDSFDLMSMPDKWEYPWFAAWDLAFHCVTLAHVDPAFAKYQLILLCREWFQNPNGALPAYEWDFGDVNPPVQAWAALEVFAIDGGRDFDFLSEVFDKLLVNFTWWVNLEDADGNNLFEGGFMGLDNIGPIDRSHLPVGGILEQSDATGWMAFYAIAMAGIAGVLQRSGRRPATGVVLKFLEHFAAITEAMDDQGLWDDADGLYYDRLLTPDGTAVPVKYRSMVGIIPMLTAAVIDEGMLTQARRSASSSRASWTGMAWPTLTSSAKPGLIRGKPGDRQLLLSVVGPDRLEKLFAKLFDTGEFLSPYGLRALSAYHRDHPYQLNVEGFSATVDYEPAESTTDMFGGNSNWRGPLWFPLNYLVISALERYYRFFGDELTIEYPAGSGHKVPLDVIAADLQDRLISLFTVGPDGRRPCFGWVDKLQHDPAWKDNLLFNEYFHGDNGAGLGASHQTGWTGLIADVIRRRHGAVSLRRRRGPYHSQGGPVMTPPRTAAPAAASRTATPASAPPAQGAAALPGSPFPLGATPGEHLGMAGTNFAVASSVADSVTLCLFDAAGAETQIPLTDNDADIWHAFVPGRRPGPGLRVPGRRPLGPGPGPALQPGQAAARPLRQGGGRDGHLRAGGARPGRHRPRQAEHPGLGRARAPQPGRGPGVQLAGRPAALAPLRGHGPVRGPRQGLHHAPPGHPARAARDLRRAGPPGRHRPT